VTLSRRIGFEANALRPKGPLFVVQNGSTTNPVLLHLVSTKREPLTFTLAVQADVPVTTNMPSTVTLPPEGSITVPAVLTFSSTTLPPGAQAHFRIAAPDGDVKETVVRLMAPNTGTPP